MANILGDSTVIPSYLGTSSRGGGPGSTAILNDVVLRFGEIKKIIYPSDSSSYSKKNLEYEIEVQHREGNGVYTTCLYRGATANTIFGGVADRFHATYRADKKGANPDTDGIGVGSKVLVLCISGDQQKAVILGGINDPKDTRTKPVKADGHNLFFEFNGIKFEINKDGEATVTFRGATKANGELTADAIPEAEGTKLKFDKEGNFTVSTPQDTQLIKVNHKDKKIEILADQEWHATVNEDLLFEVGGDASILSSGGEMNLGAANNIKMNSAGVLVGAATDNWLLGSTYRAKESAMHSMMQGALGLLSGAGALLAIPMVGPALAGPAIAAAAGMLTSAIATFESSSPDFLSKKNKHD